MGKKEDDYLICWQGATLNKKQGNIVGLTLIFGVIGSLLSVLIVGTANLILGSIIVFLFTLAGFLIGNRIFKNKLKEL